MTSIMWPTRSRVSQPVQRVITFQFLGSDTRRVKLARSRRMTLMTVSLPSAAIGLTGAITAVLIGSIPSRGLNSRPPESLMSCAARRGGRYDDGRQVELEVFPPSLVLGRQLQRRAERIGRLVHGEAGLVGGDLEQDAARLAEVDRAEVLALDDRRHVTARLDQHLAPVQLVGVVGRAPRDVVDGADRLLPHRRLRRVEHIEDRGRATRAGFEARAVALRRDLAKTHRVGQEVDGGLVRFLGQRDGVEAADLVMRIDRAVRPWLPALVGRFPGQLDLDAVEVLEHQSVGAEAGWACASDAELAQAPGPELQRPARDGERDHGHLPTPRRPPRQVGPAEEGHGAARRTEVVAEIDVVGVGDVEVDGLLDEAKSEDADIEIDVLLNVARDARHVVNSGNVGGQSHRLLPAGRTKKPMLVATCNTCSRNYSLRRLCSEASLSTRFQISAARGSPASSWIWATSPMALAITAIPRPTCQGMSSSPRMAPMAPVELTGSSRR